MEIQPDRADPFCSTKRLTGLIIGIKGAGEMASGVACSLYRSNIRKIFMMEIKNPLAVRRTVSFCEAVHSNRCTIEGVAAELALDSSDIYKAWDRDAIAVVNDPEWRTLSQLKPDVVIDATLAKINLGTTKAEAGLVIGMGPGFKAGEDVHLVIETHRGHDLGRVIELGPALPNTGVPGSIGGHTRQRLLRAPCAGIFETQLAIGAMVRQNQTIGTVGREAVTAPLSGVLRGLIHPDSHVTKGLKIGDIDPRGIIDYCYTVSDKARTLGGSVVKAILLKLNRPESATSSVASAVGLSGRGVLSLIGAGGKTSLMFSLAQVLAGAGRSVLTTTTTKILLPDKEQSPHYVVDVSWERLLAKIKDAKATMLHFSVGSEVDHNAGKLIGIPPETVDRIWQTGLFDVIIVEADGSRQHPIKASADHEPVIPSSTSHLAYVTGLDAIGQTVDTASHRADIFMGHYGLEPGTRLTPSHLADNIIREVQKADRLCHSLINTVILNKADTHLRLNQGKKIGRRLRSHGFLHRLALLTLNKDNPVKFSSRIN